MSKLKVILERYPYRYVVVGVLDNGNPDCRIQKYNDISEYYKDMYLCDNKMQLMAAIEDVDYTRWLDPSKPPCYVKDELVNPYKYE